MSKNIYRSDESTAKDDDLNSVDSSELIRIALKDNSDIFRPSTSFGHTPSKILKSEGGSFHYHPPGITPSPSKNVAKGTLSDLKRGLEEDDFWRPIL